jgi:Ser/Thr protein kinase RdoA (MazF antagonist)
VEPPPQVLQAYGLEGARIEPLRAGLINRTFDVRATHGRYILQRLHPLFDGAVHYDIEAVTAHLQRRGMLTPRLVRTGQGHLWIEAEGTWRMLTHLGGRVPSRMQGARMAREAGRLVGRFHGSLSDLVHEFHFERPGAHDTAAHLDRLARSLRRYAQHPALQGVQPVAEAILAHGEDLPGPRGLPRRIIHGDLKVTNVLFDDSLEQARALIDLDTLAHETLAVELGDALRSWCNPGGEEDPTAALDVELFEAAMRGYAESGAELLGADERDAIAAGLERISLELASRFCNDALEQAYFGWDPERFASASEHNLQRARSQLSLAQSVRAQRDSLERLLGTIFG